jgi:hypothetical protein
VKVRAPIDQIRSSRPYIRLLYLLLLLLLLLALEGVVQMSQTLDLEEDGVALLTSPRGALRFRESGEVGGSWVGERMEYGIFIRGIEEV